MSPGAHNLGNGNQIRDGVEPCPPSATNLYSEFEKGERQALLQVRSFIAKHGPKEASDFCAQRLHDIDMDCARLEANQSSLEPGSYFKAMQAANERIEALTASLDTMGGRIEELEEVLAEAERQIVRHSEFFCESDYDPLVDRIAVALGPVSRSHASHQAPAGLGRSGFDRGHGE